MIVCRLRFPPEGRQRVVMDGVAPEIDAGRFAVQAVLFANVHDPIACELLYRPGDVKERIRTRMAAQRNGCWRADFTVAAPDRYLYRVRAGVDRFTTWRLDLQKRIAADLTELAAARATGEDAARLLDWADSKDLLAAMERYPDLSLALRYKQELAAAVHRQKARFSTGYELFPRSTALRAGRFGTFADCETRLPYIAAMGFEVVYLPPIPMGHQFRTGTNNSAVAQTRDVGSSFCGGCGQGNMGGVEASPLPKHGRPWPLSVTAPPLGAVIFKASGGRT